MEVEVEVGVEAEVEVGVVEVVEVVEGDIDIVDLVEATTPMDSLTMEVSEIVLEHIPFNYSGPPERI